MARQTEQISPKQRNDGFAAFATDLISLVEQVQASVQLIEPAIAREAPAGDLDRADIVVLDDLMPQYMTANRAPMPACKPRHRRGSSCSTVRRRAWPD